MSPLSRARVQAPLAAQGRVLMPLPLPHPRSCAAQQVRFVESAGAFGAFRRNKYGAESDVESEAESGDEVGSESGSGSEEEE